VTWIRVTPSVANLAVAPRARGRHAGSDAGRAFAFAETEHIPEVIAENAALTRLLIPPHLVLSGGWQARIVERAVVLPPDATLRIPVKCVEPDRWSPRDDRTGRVLTSMDRSGIRARWALAARMVSELNEHGRFTADQDSVWRIVDEALKTATGADPGANRTRSYEAYADGPRRQFVARAHDARVSPPPEANGVVVLPHGGGFWLEAFASPEALADHADDLIADLFDPAGDANLTAPITSDGEWLLDVVWRQPLTPIDTVAGTLGTSYAATTSAVGEVVLLEGALAHIALGAPPPVTARDPARSVAAAATAEESGPRPRVSASGTPIELPRVDVETMRSMFLRAARLFPETAPAPENVRGFRLVRVLDRNVSWIDIRIDGDGYAVCGSHDRCDLVLSQDSGIWLRHLVAVAVRLDDGTVGMRLIDLKTDLPFFLDDDVARWSVVARGTFAIRLGRHVLCGFPIGAASATDPVSPTPPKVRPPGSLAPDAVDPRATDAADSNGGETTDTIGNSLAINPPRAVITAPPASEIQAFVGPAPSSDHVRVTLERAGIGASVELPLARLDAGVLLGRALNTFDGGLRRIFCEAISRVHVLLLRDATGVYALDLCTTNGTRANGRRIRRHVLADAGTTLELGKKVTFRWRR
jgi:hypothetical protein